MISLRDYQQKAVDEIRSAYQAGHRSVLLQSATGSGKTICFAYFASKLKPQFRALILAHRDELIRQASEKLEQFGIEYGVIAPGHHRSRARIQLASVMTMVRRLHEHEPFDFIIVDEAHHLPAGSFKKVVQHYPNAHLLCCTGTPQRLDGLGLSDFCDYMVKGPSISWLAEQGYLARCETYGPPTNIDLSAVHLRMGDYVKSEIETAVDKASITGDAVEHYRKLVNGKPALAFCVSLKHCEHVAEQFRRGGFRAASIDGNMDMGQRRRLISDLAAGHLNVLTSCELLTEGLDVPAAQAVIMLRPTWSLTLFLQACGRGMRPKPDGSPMLLLDHVRNCERHGLPEIDREWSLEGRKKTQKQRERESQELSVRVCQGCYCVFRSQLKKCPKCGKEVEIQGREIEERPGELVRLTPEQKRALWAEEQRDPNVKLVRASVDADWEKKERARLLAAGRPRRQVEAIIASKKKKIQQQSEQLRAANA